MKLCFVLAVSLLLSTVLAKKEAKDEIDLIQEDEAAEKVEETKKPVVGDEKLPHPCAKIRCGTGKECDVDDNGKGKCVCVKRCPLEKDERRKVCSNHNETWESDCALYKMRCLCTQDSEECEHKKYKHVHVDYYGVCKEIPECADEEMEDFPRRMRDWLFNIMKDMARRDELDEPYLKMEKEAEDSLSRKWVNAIIWKFCDLDSHPHDRSISRHELFPIRAPLVSLEHCIAPFLDKCDTNDDHRITLEEWGICLGLEANEIEDKCVEIREKERVNLDM